jgi:hypothetical protein
MGRVALLAPKGAGPVAEDWVIGRYWFGVS